ncbi:hypothetical protein [Aurantiacibacter marinus]|uniref:SH3 domain-containing protein n=1 Tax=Aurantiacibacter marinus TaxID=874156 RepID=A0A0H0XRK0_9SPHN|nr:hypothetical protein [Aurantiacibacter marinus]KLI64572.1 hypothetical protein AAV99_03140 [Aurantiacibacter marinus]
MTRFAIILASPILAALAVPANAQDAADDPYGECAAIEDSAERLECFDNTYARQRVVIAERAVRAEEERAEVFGFRDEDAVLERTRDPDASITATVSEVLQGALRSQVLLMDNGQLWREISGSTLRNRIREGWTATITRHWSGAYEMRFEGRTGYLRVARVQ